MLTIENVACVSKGKDLSKRDELINCHTCKQPVSSYYDTTYQSRQDNPVISPKFDSLDSPRPESSNNRDDGQKREDGAQDECCFVDLTHGDRFSQTNESLAKDKRCLLGRKLKVQRKVSDLRYVRGPFPVL